MKKLTCKDASRLISEGCERPLSSGERWSLRLHLWICDNCRRFERQLYFLRSVFNGLAARVAEDDAGPDLSPAARERIRNALAQREPPPPG